MGKTEVYTPEQLNNAERLIQAIQSVPEEKRPILTAVIGGFLAGMEAQERLTEKRAG